MENIKDLIREAVKTAPLSLLTLNQESINFANPLLPYSVGIEIECYKSERFDISNFHNIPNIMDVNIDDCEQRFRIPNGVLGIICLYHISKQLRVNSMLNTGSGIHYHVDMTQTFHLLTYDKKKNNRDWIIDELESWNYKGTYNSKEIGDGHNWIRFSSEFKTAEFRIGEMTFDYSLLLKRIFHANEIIKKLNENICVDDNSVTYQGINKNQILEYCKATKDILKPNKILNLLKKLRELEEENSNEENFEDIKNKIKKRRINYE